MITGFDGIRDNKTYRYFLRFDLYAHKAYVKHMSTVVYQNGFNILIRTRETSHKHMPHCHAVGQGFEARVHLESFEVLTNTGFSRNDMRKITDAVRFHKDELLDKWREYHGQD